jgi:hypothetical protein
MPITLEGGPHLPLGGRILSIGAIISIRSSPTQNSPRRGGAAL